MKAMKWMVLVVGLVVCLGAKKDGRTEDGVRFEVDDAKKVKLENFTDRDWKEIERAYGSELFFVVLRIKNTSREEFVWASYHEAKCWCRGEKLFTRVSLTGTLYRADLTDATRRLLGSVEVAAGSEAVVVMAYPAELSWLQVGRVELEKFGRLVATLQ